MCPVVPCGQSSDPYVRPLHFLPPWTAWSFSYPWSSWSLSFLLQAPKSLNQMRDSVWFQNLTPPPPKAPPQNPTLALPSWPSVLLMPSWQQLSSLLSFLPQQPANLLPKMSHPFDLFRLSFDVLWACEPFRPSPSYQCLQVHRHHCFHCQAFWVFDPVASPKKHFQPSTLCWACRSLPSQAWGHCLLSSELKTLEEHWVEPNAKMMGEQS